MQDNIADLSHEDCTMPTVADDPITLELSSRSGLGASLNRNGSLRRLDYGAIALALFVGNEIEGGPANLYLRRHGDRIEWTALLGPSSATRFSLDPHGGAVQGRGRWGDIGYLIELRLAAGSPAWFWRVQLENQGAGELTLDLTYAQDLALAPYGAVRLNEFYVSQYLDHTALSHPTQGFVVASRQNLAADGRNPWSLIGSLRKGAGFATDALQFHGLAGRSGEVPAGLTADLPSHRLQHEHAMVVLRDAPMRLKPGESTGTGFFGLYVEDHPEATSQEDLRRLDAVLALPEATAGPLTKTAPAVEKSDGLGTLFSCAHPLAVQDLSTPELQSLFVGPWRHLEVGESGETLSFFHGVDRHVVLRAKELRVLRPHGHLLRSGRQTTPDETSLTSTTWMSGVFHSMLTQGHVSINRMLSTVHSYLGLFRSHGQRVFVQIGSDWRLLEVPSAFEMSPTGCSWLYRYDGGEIQVHSEAGADAHEMTLALRVTSGAPLRFLISHHLSLNGDDGSVPGAALWRQQGQEIIARPAAGSELGQRFPEGSFSIGALPGTAFEKVGGDELLFLDGRSRQQPFLCLVTAPTATAGLRIQGHLLANSTPPPLTLDDARGLSPTLAMRIPERSPLAAGAARIAEMAPWYAQNAWVHYLAPRGLEQYSGGGWGTRDVCQGPIEMLLALERVEPIRDLLLRVMKQQNPDGDWPQWFMFFERERNIRPGDSHGDIIFWPLLVLAQYLIASGDTGILEEQVRFFDGRGPDQGENTTVWHHVLRALELTKKRVIPGTALAAYGHGDWNDSLQPVEASMRHQLCSSWTVTLQFQTLKTLATALRGIGRGTEAAGLDEQAQAVLRDFQRLLLPDGVLAGYVQFMDDGTIRYLLHPRDETTGLRYSSLGMIHAVLEDLLTPDQAREHLRLIQMHMSTPDGVRLFDHPMAYHGGKQRLFQRAETATFFGREIGLMYTHAHLRHAQALAHVGEADRFFHALCQANPIAIASLVPRATLRQANCYYSSSDAAFVDRYQASEEYERIAQGTIDLDGGWRVYSSGAGISLGLIVRRFLGISREAEALRLDPVIPAALDGLRVKTSLADRPLEIEYGIANPGCGVKQLTLNGRPLPFTRADNPHRPGAALAPMPAVLAQLRVDGNLLRIELGG
jgi:1,2-beta-oligoglucan phosphorylase